MCFQENNQRSGFDLITYNLIRREKKRIDLSCRQKHDYRCVWAYLDGAGSDVTVVRHSSGEGWAIVESEGWFVLGAFKLLVEGIDLFPVGEDALLLLWEVWPFWH